MQPTQVSESEIQLVAATVSEHWNLLANILGIVEDEFTKFSVSITFSVHNVKSYYYSTTMSWCTRCDCEVGVIRYHDVGVRVQFVDEIQEHIINRRYRYLRLIVCFWISSTNWTRTPTSWLNVKLKIPVLWNDREGECKECEVITVCPSGAHCVRFREPSYCDVEILGGAEKRGCH